MRLIDADALLQQIAEDSRGNEGWYGDTWEFINTIKDAPTVDAVRVVRCKDCRYFGEMYSRTPEGNEWHYCGIAIVSGVLADDYCSYGERRNDDRKNIQT